MTTNGDDDDDDDKKNGKKGNKKSYDAPNLPFVRGSDTSEDAAKSMKHIAPSDEARVYALFEKAGSYGVTDKEIELALGMIHESASARRNGLVLKGKVKNSGDKRRSPSGRKVTVWILGKGVPTEGAKNRRSSRPTDETIRAAVKNIQVLIDMTKENLTTADWVAKGNVGEELTLLLAWLERTAAK